MVVQDAVDLIGTAQDFAPQIEAAREESERNRSLPGPLVEVRPGAPVRPVGLGLSRFG